MRFLVIVLLVTSWSSVPAPLLQVPRASSRDGYSQPAEVALLDEVEAALGKEFRLRTQERLGKIEEMLDPIFAAMPHNEHGRLNRDAVKYLLRRLLLSRQAWVLSGLEHRDAQETSWISKVLVKEVVQSNATFLSSGVEEEDSPCWIAQALFETRMAKTGSSLVDVAVLTSLVEQSVHSDLEGKLRVSYGVRGVPVDEVLNKTRAQDLIDLTLMSFTRGRNISSWSPTLIADLERTMPLLWPPWPKFLPVVRRVQEELSKGMTEYRFNDLAATVTALAERFGDWNDMECRNDKEALLELEERERSGRVKLLDYYNAAIVKGKYQFTENIDYLRQSGLLDESDPLVPKVVISNYLQSPSNCVARTGFYSVCCRDQCQGILGQLETEIAAHAAVPAEIIDVVRRLPSETMPARHKLSKKLVRALNWIADRQGGKVELHGRLFSHWLHLAYPSECSFMHLSAGVTQGMLMEEWEKQTGERSSATRAQILEYIEDLREKQEERRQHPLKKKSRRRWHKEPTEAADDSADHLPVEGEEVHEEMYSFFDDPDHLDL
eukprot:TRINITY_DN15789_c0_g2_i4.p1 TRINITY_DN15789_c0_g2~~TRINITY_DN15789_c0_g2_i4.p1  ORF type:complete len:550 (-),score=120.37 TRINITY_DN15789_c0_g2_i4:127-1776(-)